MRIFYLYNYLNQFGMNRKLSYALLSILLPAIVWGQNGTVQNAAMPKDAPVNVLVTDFKNNVLNHEIVVFKSKLTGKDYEGLTDSTGRFTFRLPAGDSYEMYILGFKDSTSYNVMEIPALKDNQTYNNPVKVNIKFLTEKGFVIEW